MVESPLVVREGRQGNWDPKSTHTELPGLQTPLSIRRISWPFLHVLNQWTMLRSVRCKASGEAAPNIWISYLGDGSGSKIPKNITKPTLSCLLGFGKENHFTKCLLSSSYILLPGLHDSLRVKWTLGFLRREGSGFERHRKASGEQETAAFWRDRFEERKGPQGHVLNQSHTIHPWTQVRPHITLLTLLLTNNLGLETEEHLEQSLTPTLLRMVIFVPKPSKCLVDCTL